MMRDKEVSDNFDLEDFNIEDVDGDETVIQDEQPKKRKRRSKEEIEADKKNDAHYVDKDQLMNALREWRAKVDAHNQQHKSIIDDYKNTLIENPKYKNLWSDDLDGQDIDDFSLTQEAILAAVRSKSIPSEPRMPDYIGDCIMKICGGLAKKANWRNYTWVDEMISAAVLDCVKAAKKFDLVKFDNPFAYFTSTAHYAFINKLKKEKNASKLAMNSLLDPEIETYTQSAFNDHMIDTEEARSTYYRNK